MKKHATKLTPIRKYDFGLMEQKPFIEDKREITKAIYLIGTTRGLYAGHAALVLVDSEGRGTLFSSQFDIKKLKEIGKGKWIPYELYRQELSPEELTNYFKTGVIMPKNNENKIAGKYLSAYDKYIVIPVENPYLGKIMLTHAEQIHNEPGLFNLYERNCNHLCQDILATGGLNFTPTKGSCELVKTQIENVEHYVKKWDLLNALYYLKAEYKKDFDMGIIPNGAYEQGVIWAKKNNYEYGTIGKAKDTYKPKNRMLTKPYECFS